MLTRIVELIAAAFGQRLEARLAQETAARLEGFGRRVELALAAGDVTAEGLAGDGKAAVADKPKRREK